MVPVDSAAVDELELADKSFPLVDPLLLSTGEAGLEEELAEELSGEYELESPPELLSDLSGLLPAALLPELSAPPLERSSWVLLLERRE